MFGSNDVTIENITNNESGTWDPTKSRTEPPNGFLTTFGARTTSSEDVNYTIQCGCFKVGDNLQLPDRVLEKTNWDFLQSGSSANTWSNEPLQPTRWEVPIPSTVVASKPDFGDILLGENGPAISIQRNSGETMITQG